MYNNHIDGLVKDCSNSIADALELLRSYTKPSTWWWFPTRPLSTLLSHLNKLRPRQNGCHFPDNIFKRIFLNQNVRLPINISLKFVPKGPINNIPALVQIMAGRRPGDKPLSETVLVSLLTHMCVTQPQWVKVKSMVNWPHCTKGLLMQSLYILHFVWLNNLGLFYPHSYLASRHAWVIRSIVYVPCNY